MSNPLIYDCDNYLVIEPSQSEKFLNKDETLKWLEKWLAKMDELPLDLKNEDCLKNAAQRLLDTSCDLRISQGFTIQWFAIRLDSSAL